MKNSDVYYGIVLFFIIKSILEIIGITGSFLTIYFTLNLYFSSILVLLTTIIMPWVLPIIILINMSIGYLDLPDFDGR